MSIPVSVYFRSKICLFANIVLIFDHFWPKLTKIESKMIEKSRQAGWNLLFNFAGICFRQNCLSALKLRIKIDFKFGPFSVHIYTTVFIGLFFCPFELSETKISKINFWMKIFDTFRLCWNSQIWLDNHNNRYQYTCNIELERIFRSFTVYTSVHICSPKIAITQTLWWQWCWWHCYVGDLMMVTG